MNSAPLKILFLSADKFPPFRVDVCVLFGKEIVGKGHSIDWLLQSDQSIDHAMETKWYGGHVIVGKTDTGPSLWHRFRLHLYNFVNDLKMFRMMANTQYDIVIVKDKFVAGVMAALSTGLNNTKFVYWLSFPFDEDSFFRVKEKTVRYPLLYWMRGILFHLFLYKIIMPACDHALVQTEYMKINMVKRGVPSGKMTAVPMAVSLKDIPSYGHPRHSAKIRSGPTIVYLGTLIRIRRMDFLLRAFKLVLNQVHDAKLFLVGGSEVKADEEELEREAERLGISHAVTITGFLPQQEAWCYVEQADVCVSPIYPSPIFDVGSPTKLLEYMAMGKAAVANDHPEQRVVLAESKAGLCVPWDEHAFCEAIVYLIQHQDIAQQMGIWGRKYIQDKRNYTQTSNIVEQILLSVAGKLNDHN